LTAWVAKDYNVRIKPKIILYYDYANKELFCMFCYKCGKSLPSESGFCPYCGTKAVATEISSSDTTKSENETVSLPVQTPVQQLSYNPTPQVLYPQGTTIKYPTKEQKPYNNMFLKLSILLGSLSLLTSIGSFIRYSSIVNSRHLRNSDRLYALRRDELVGGNGYSLRLENSFVSAERFVESTFGVFATISMLVMIVAIVLLVKHISMARSEAKLLNKTFLSPQDLDYINCRECNYRNNKDRDFCVKCGSSM
jgi:RNA polymerase subunit RPABC4/transcription elongation factor Spt4